MQYVILNYHGNTFLFLYTFTLGLKRIRYLQSWIGKNRWNLIHGLKCIYLSQLEKLWRIIRGKLKHCMILLCIGFSMWCTFVYVYILTRRWVLCAHYCECTCSLTVFALKCVVNSSAHCSNNSIQDSYFSWIIIPLLFIPLYVKGSLKVSYAVVWICTVAICTCMRLQVFDIVLLETCGCSRKNKTWTH